MSIDDRWDHLKKVFLPSMVFMEQKENNEDNTLVEMFKWKMPHITYLGNIRTLDITSQEKIESFSNI